MSDKYKIRHKTKQKKKMQVKQVNIREMPFSKLEAVLVLGDRFAALAMTDKK